MFVDLVKGGTEQQVGVEVGVVAPFAPPFSVNQVPLLLPFLLLYLRHFLPHLLQYDLFLFDRLQLFTIDAAFVLIRIAFALASVAFVLYKRLVAAKFHQVVRVLVVYRRLVSRYVPRQRHVLRFVHGISQWGRNRTEDAVVQGLGLVAGS